MWALYILLSWLIADFITGIIHWFQDLYLPLNIENKFLKIMAIENDTHHYLPHHITTQSPFSSIKYPLIYISPLTLLLALLPISILFPLTLFFISIANLVHYYSHERYSKLPTVVKFLQKIGLMAAPYRGHYTHHYEAGYVIPRTKTYSNYCFMSDWLNPILNRIHFFHHLESLLLKLNIVKLN